MADINWKSSAKRRALSVFEELKILYPVVESALISSNPFEKLAATILSAQCTDARVNMVTPELFKKYPDPASMAGAELLDIETIIHSTGFYHAKAAHLKGMAEMIIEKFEGTVPAEIDKLIQLPGVARKTANCVLNDCFGIASGIVVDTHVARLALRFGFSKGPKNNAVKIENDLMAIFKKDTWIELSHLFIYHGRTICHSRKPQCPECTLKNLCFEYNNNNK
ncbi:endonuclease III [Myxococcota bacterium]|nr:endonuclease III [Myxococcota bacterium]MBU1380810.1 endonuclease III [Myxococcota bacterium]MBU1498944.1 endonuclease III [Myxococcota bacterium]